MREPLNAQFTGSWLLTVQDNADANSRERSEGGIMDSENIIIIVAIALFLGSIASLEIYSRRKNNRAKEGEGQVNEQAALVDHPGTEHKRRAEGKSG